MEFDSQLDSTMIESFVETFNRIHLNELLDYTTYKPKVGAEPIVASISYSDSSLSGSTLNFTRPLTYYTGS